LETRSLLETEEALLPGYAKRTMGDRKKKGAMEEDTTKKGM